MTLNLPHVLLNDCVIINIKSLHCKVLSFYHILWQVQFKASISGVKKTFSVWAFKNIITEDHSGHKGGGQQSLHDWMLPHMLGLQPHQRHHYLEHYISAIKLASNQY